MLESFIFSQFISALLTTLIGIGFILFIRKKTQHNGKENNPAGFWIRAICFGTDLAIIDIIACFLAFHGSMKVASEITLLITVSYFFFFWLFFAATPAMIFAKIKILSQDGEPLKIWQVLVRFSMLLFLFVGWIPMLFDKKEKKALHDIVSKTRVAYFGKEAKVTERRMKKIKLLMLGMSMVLLAGLMVHGLGEKLSKYTQNNQVRFFDLNKDGITDGLTIDLDGDGKADVFKYDLNNDNIVDFTTFDTDKDGVAESIDINNDGRIDGFDFDNDNVLNTQVSGGQFLIWLWRVLFGLWIVVFVILLVLGVVKENKT